jgi:hypothetical protein
LASRPPAGQTTPTRRPQTRIVRRGVHIGSRVLGFSPVGVENGRKSRARAAAGRCSFDFFWSFWVGGAGAGRRPGPRAGRTAKTQRLRHRRRDARSPRRRCVRRARGARGFAPRGGPGRRTNVREAPGPTARLFLPSQNF